MQDVSNNFTKKINSDKLTANAILQVYDMSLAGRCSAFVVQLMGMDTRGQLDNNVAGGAGMISAMTEYHRRFNILNGMSAATYDKKLEPYLNEFRQNNYQVSQLTIDACFDANDKFVEIIKKASTKTNTEELVSKNTIPITKPEKFGNVVDGKFTGAWFSINVPSGFRIKPSLKSSTSNIQNAFDSVFFVSPAGDVEFYVFSPQWMGRPTDFECNPTVEGTPSLDKKGNSKKLFEYSTCAAKDNSYTKSLVLITENQNINYAFGIKYKNQVAYEKYKAEYLSFKNSLKQFSDGR